ncbi:hypothetical protein ABW16_19700 [Mycolicibacter heraklionensis]|uniref:Uncharacterized protein n=1 Tax=Mycolicibacter heraklionensis TaxID=512402 RepID=A0ABR5FAS5_9MYCO|nr:hypothetical protein [Mycolicibacter heraklionensis]KLO26343.1 hypothetical protein ABW16_19700 [Mycolicibacter heraklionensis]
MKNPLPFGLTALGAVAMMIATFLPYFESRRFLRIEGNAMIQSADGWILIAVAIGVVVCAYHADQGERNYRIAARVLPLLGAGCLFVIWANKGARTLYPVGIDGTVNADAPGEVANLGVGFYLAAVGVGLAATGTRLLWNATKPEPSIVDDDDDDEWDDDFELDEDLDEDEDEASPPPRRTTLGDMIPRNKAAKPATDEP